MGNEEKELIEYLKQFVSEDRLSKFDKILDERTRHITIVLEDIYQAHNASAVLRSCDCFGIQDVHFIESRNRYKISTDVDMGASQWLTINRINSPERKNTISYLNELKTKGYKIVATTPHEKDCTLDQLDITQKTALVFGTEIDGITDEIRSAADEFVRIPMYGFTESFNISVSAALCLYELTTRMRADKNISYKLSDAEREVLWLEWLGNSIKKVDLIIKDWKEKRK